MDSKLHYSQRSRAVNKTTSSRSPTVPIKQWTVTTSIEFLILHEQHSNHWLQVSKIIKHKTEHDVKNHFYSLLRKYINKISNNSFEFDGHLDIIQCHYIIEHIIHHFSCRQNAKKEYLSTLISLRKITNIQCVKYYELLCTLHPYIKKVGWKNYILELSKLEPLTISGYCFPNRVLPQVSICKEGLLPLEDKKCFMDVWTQDLSAAMNSCNFN